MHFDSKRAMIMLLAVVLWTAAPMIAWVLGLGAHSKHDCCAAMAMQDCSGDSMECNSCCHLSPAPLNAMLVSAGAPNHTQEAGEPLWSAYIQVLPDLHAGRQTFREAPPPAPSPGGLSVLRI